MPKVLKEISFLLKLIKNLNHHMKTDIDWKLKIALENVILLNLSLEDLMSFRKSRLNCRSQRFAASSLKRQGRGNCEEYCHAILSAKTYLL